VPVSPAPSSVPVPAHAAEPKVTLRADSAFRFNGGDVAAMLPGGKAQLNAVVAGLQRAKGIQRLTINGYTDRLGSDAYNQQLSLQRALTVKAYLIKHGVTLPISVAGRGKANPLVECSQTDRFSARRELIAAKRMSGGIDDLTSHPAAVRRVEASLLRRSVSLKRDAHVPLIKDFARRTM
jgi:OOP family OmpA-OmpF porin